MKKRLSAIIALFFCFTIFAQETITAEKEILKTIECGSGTNDLKFIVEEEITRLPRGPFINSEGDLVFYYNDRPNYSAIFSNNEFTVTTQNYFEYAESFPLNGQNIGGYIFTPNQTRIQNFQDGKIHWISINEETCDIPESDLPPKAASNYYPVEKGIIVDYISTYKHDPCQYGIEIKDGKIVKTIKPAEVNVWLSTQKGNYEIKKDSDGYNRVFKNGIIWSATYPDKTNRFVCRLRSGHVVYTPNRTDTKNYSMPRFIIARTDDVVEMILDIPWSGKNDYEEGKNRYSYSFGSWGEMYALIHPAYNGSNYVTEGTAELVVVRNYLKSFGILNDDRIRLRKGPGTDTESLGTYPLNTGFRILENSGVKQTIGGVTDEWIKVRLLDGTEGYFFGQYVQNLYDGPGTSLPWPNVTE